jgi:hypothetical protein
MFTLNYTSGATVRTGRDGHPWKCNHAATARAEALDRAIRLGQPIAVVRAGKVSYIMHPDGTRTAPLGMTAPPLEQCSAGTGKACFCTPCRNERRGS